MKIQLKTASRQSNPTDYWKDVSTENRPHPYLDKEELAYFSIHSTLDKTLESATANEFVVDRNKYNMDDETDYLVTVYDDYME